MSKFNVLAILLSILTTTSFAQELNCKFSGIEVSIDLPKDACDGSGAAPAQAFVSSHGSEVGVFDVQCEAYASGQYTNRGGVLGKTYYFSISLEDNKGNKIFIDNDSRVSYTSGSSSYIDLEAIGERVRFSGAQDCNYFSYLEDAGFISMAPPVSQKDQ